MSTYGTSKAYEIKLYPRQNSGFITEVIKAQGHYFDPNIPGILIIQCQDGNFYYIPLTNYNQIIIDGAGLEKVKAEAETAKAEAN
jgi:hypothetical protein